MKERNSELEKLTSEINSQVGAIDAALSPEVIEIKKTFDDKVANLEKQVAELEKELEDSKFNEQQMQQELSKLKDGGEERKYSYYESSYF